MGHDPSGMQAAVFSELLCTVILVQHSGSQTQENLIMTDYHELQ